MKITLNGEARDLAGPSVTDALTQIGLGSAKVATALERQLARRRPRHHHVERGDALKWPHAGG